MNGGQKRHVLRLWREFAHYNSPVVSTTAGEVYFQLAEDLYWEWGGVSNTGMLVEERVPYDKDKSFDGNIYEIIEHIMEECH